MKPADVHIGVIEFFSIVLPGALLTAALVAVWSGPPPMSRLVLSSTAVEWVAFAILAYTLGHFIFLIASVLDHPLYDRYRNWRWPKRPDGAYALALIERNRFFGRPLDFARDVPMNTFVWAKSLLVMHCPVANAAVEHFEADSKFFRSLVIALPLVGAVLAHAGSPLALPTSLALSLLSFVRYAERRNKSTEWAYRYALVLCRDRELQAKASDQPALLDRGGNESGE